MVVYQVIIFLSFFIYGILILREVYSKGQDSIPALFAWKGESVKDKRIEIRLSSDLYYTFIGYARSLGISVTDLIIESVLASEVVKIQEVSDIEMERIMCMKKIGDNINQVARAMNGIYKKVQQTTDTDLLFANADFKSLLMEVRDIKNKFFSCIEAERMNKEEFYSFLVTRNINPELEKYLQENDPIYLKQLKNRENGT